MSDFNRVVMTGNLTKDAVLNELQNSMVLEFRIASNRVYYDREDKEQKDVAFIDCKYRGALDNKRLPALLPMLPKGKRVLIEGRLSLEEWTDSETDTKRSKHVITVTDMQPIGIPAGVKATEAAAVAPGAVKTRTATQAAAEKKAAAAQAEGEEGGAEGEQPQEVELDAATLAAAQKQLAAQAKAKAKAQPAVAARGRKVLTPDEGPEIEA